MFSKRTAPSGECFYIFSVCHVHGHASLFLDRLGFQYKLNGDDRSVPNFCVYVICICVLCCVKSAIL